MLSRGRAKVSFEAKLHGGKEVVRVLEIIRGLGEEEVTGEGEGGGLTTPSSAGALSPTTSIAGHLQQKIDNIERSSCKGGGELLKNLTFGTIYLFIFAVCS